MGKEIERRIRGFLNDPAAGAFGDLALALFEEQYERLADYRSECDRAGVSPGSFRDWREIPAVAAAGVPQEGPLSRELIEPALAFLFDTGPVSLIAGFEEAQSPAASSILEAAVETAPEGSFLSPRARPDSRALRSWLGARQRDRRPVRLIATEPGYRALIETLQRRSLKFRLPPGSRAHLLATLDELNASGRAGSVDSGAAGEPPDLAARAEEWLGLAPGDSPRLLVRPGATPLVESTLQPRSFHLPHWVRGARGRSGRWTLLDLASLTVPAHVHAPAGAELQDDRRLLLSEG